MSDARPGSLPNHEVSVIVPTLNGARFIAETIASIVAQTAAPGEIIVVDDGSIDETTSVARSASPCVKVIQTQGLGPAGARNAGIGIASGRFLAFLDHDDLWVPEKLAVQTALLDSDPEIDICLGMIRSFQDGPPAAERKWLGDPVPGYLTITMLARRTAFERIGLLDQLRPFSDSAEWLLRAEDAGLRTKMLDRELTYHRVHDRNHSRLNGARSRAEFLDLARRRMSHARQVGARTPQPCT